MKMLLSVASVAMVMASAAQSETINRRAECDRWEHIPASEELGSSASALLFCNREETKWLALRIDCNVEDVRMEVHYRPGFEFSPPASQEELQNGAQGQDVLSAEDREAAALVAAIPYEDSGIKAEWDSIGGPTEMVFMDFQSFGYTGVAHFEEPQSQWRFVEKEPLSPIFSRLISGNYADIKLLAYDVTERFPLRGSSKALRPVVEACRVAKRDAAKSANN